MAKKESTVAVVSFINPKGGTGKTTSALLLAEQIANLENRVAVIDCDPNSNLLFWKQQRDGQERDTPFEVHERPETLHLIDLIDDLDQKMDLVIVDLEGSADQIVTFALARTDLSLIPFKPSPMEARQCARAVNLIRQSAKISRSSNAFRLLFTRANAAIRTYDEKSVVLELAKNGLEKDILPVKLVERAAFTRIFHNHDLLAEIEKSGVSNWSAAVENAAGYAQAVLDALEQEMM